jgi:Na+/proline symporter
MDTWQRACAARSAQTAVDGMKWGTVGLLLGIAAFGSIGIYDHLVLMPSLGGSPAFSGGLNPLTDLYLLEPTLSSFEAALLGFVAVAFVMAGMSTADTFLVVCGHSFVSDLLVGFGKGAKFGELTDRESRFFTGIGRATIVVMGVAVISMFFILSWLDLLGNPLALFYLAYSIQFALLAPMIASIWNRKPPAWVALVALVVGIVIALIWGFGFAIAGRAGVVEFNSMTLEELVYLAPVPTMLGGFLIVGFWRIFGNAGATS